MVSEDEPRLFSALQEPDAHEEETETEKNAALCLPKISGFSGWLFPWIPHTCCTWRMIYPVFTKFHCGSGTFFSTSQSEIASVTKTWIPKPLFHISTRVSKIHMAKSIFFPNSITLLGQIIDRFFCNDHSKCLAQGVSLLEASRGWRTGFGFASPNWVKQPNSPELSWKLPREEQFLLISSIYRTSEGNSIPIDRSKKSTLRPYKKSQCLVEKCSGGKVFSGQTCKASSFHNQTLQGKDGAAKLIKTEVGSHFFFGKNFAMAGATPGFYCTPEFCLFFKRHNRKRNTFTFQMVRWT